MRKKTRIYYQLLILGIVMTSLLSCYGDKDSEATDDIQQVTAINGIATDGSYTLYQGDTLRINPSLHSLKGLIPCAMTTVGWWVNSRK